MVRAYVGTSGYAYDAWKGSFYPEKLKSQEMLSFYAQHLHALEINNTYYRIPRATVVKRWADTVPAEFRFTIKASRRITHQARLADTEGSVGYMMSQLEPLGDKLAALLFLCPPFLRKDTDLLRTFLSSLPSGPRIVLELRHQSWFCEEAYDVLREHQAALCIADYEDSRAKIAPGGRTPEVVTAPFGYLRLRRDYSDEDLDEWAALIREKFDEAYVFFEHKEAAPGLAQRLASKLAESPASPRR